VESIRRGRTLRRGIGKRLNDLDLLDDRAGPAVRDDHRQRVFMLRAHVDEVNVEPVDLGNEIRQGIEPGLNLAPVVVLRPIAGEFLHRCKLHALRCVLDRFLLGPVRRLDATPEIHERLF
jgi:hypothetical protein